MFLFERFRAIHKYTQNVHGSTKFLIVPLSLRACCLFSCLGPQRETRGGRGEFIPSIHHRGEGAGRRRRRMWRVKKERGNEETRVCGVLFFFLLCWVRREVSSAFWQLGCETSARLIDCSCLIHVTVLYKSPQIFSSLVKISCPLSVRTCCFSFLAHYSAWFTLYMQQQFGFNMSSHVFWIKKTTEEYTCAI